MMMHQTDKKQWRLQIVAISKIVVYPVIQFIQSIYLVLIDIFLCQHFLVEPTPYTVSLYCVRLMPEVFY